MGRLSKQDRIETRYPRERAERGVYALYSEGERKECNVDGLLDGLVRSTKAVMTRVELGGTLFLVAVIGVLLTSQGEEGK